MLMKCNKELETFPKIILEIDTRDVMSTEDRYMHFALPLDFTSLSGIYE